MKQITVRLKPGQFLREEIERIAQEKQIRAGIILSIVGGIQNAVLRMPQSDNGEHEVKTLKGPFEIVSCTGTVSMNGCHLHAAVSGRDGLCYGGHLKMGCEVFFTVELVIGILEDTTYRREMDAETGFEELVVEQPSV